MALEKKVTYDYEVRGEFKCIQQRARTAVEEDGKEITFTFHRTAFMPDADISGESDELKALANAVWTDAVKKAYEDSKED
jgi:hypothetical protein